MSYNIHGDGKICSICGFKSNQAWCWDKIEGYQDLDLRTPRDKVPEIFETNVEECPNCGFVASDLEWETNVSSSFLKSAEYQNCDGFVFKSNLAKKFYRRYLISKLDEKYMIAFENLVSCSWACDDSNDYENSQLIRNLAIELSDKDYFKQDKDFKYYKLRVPIIKADFLRRNGEFEKLINGYRDIKLDDAFFDEIIQFQIQKAKEQDNKCYTTRELIPDEIDESELKQIEELFHEVIYQVSKGNNRFSSRTEFKMFLKEHNLELPKITRELINKTPLKWLPIPGMYGGFAFELIFEGSELVLYSDSWCRVVDGSGKRYKITNHSCDLIDEGFV